MKQMTPAAVERAMKLQDVMLRAMAKRITWYQAAEILGLSGRQMLRWQTRFKHEGYEGLFDRRRGVPAPKRVPLETVETVLRLYQEEYFDFNVLTTRTLSPADMLPRVATHRRGADLNRSVHSTVRACSGVVILY